MTASEPKVLKKVSIPTQIVLFLLFPHPSTLISNLLAPQTVALYFLPVGSDTSKGRDQCLVASHWPLSISASP